MGYRPLVGLIPHFSFIRDHLGSGLENSGRLPPAIDNMRFANPRSGAANPHRHRFDGL